MKIHIVKVWVRKWNCDLGYLTLEQCTVKRFADLIRRGYTLRPESTWIEK